MSATTNINVRVDAELKQSAETLFHDLGLTMSGAITLFLRAAVNYNGIPFEVKRPEPNAALAECKEMRTYKRYHSADELFDEVLQDV